MSNPLERIAFELEAIRDILERSLSPVPIPTPPEKKFGAEAISYISESALLEQEEEELRQISNGLIPEQPD